MTEAELAKFISDCLWAYVLPWENENLAPWPNPDKMGTDEIAAWMAAEISRRAK